MRPCSQWMATRSCGHSCGQKLDDEPTCDVLDAAAHWVDFHTFDGFQIEQKDAVKGAANHAQKALRIMWRAQDKLDEALHDVEKKLDPLKSMVNSQLSKSHAIDNGEQHAARQRATSMWLGKKKDEAHASLRTADLAAAVKEAKEKHTYALQALVNVVEKECGPLGAAKRTSTPEPDLDPELASMMAAEIQALTASTNTGPDEPPATPAIATAPADVGNTEAAKDALTLDEPPATKATASEPADVGTTDTPQNTPDNTTASPLGESHATPAIASGPADVDTTDANKDADPANTSASPDSGAPPQPLAALTPDVPCPD